MTASPMDDAIPKASQSPMIETAMVGVPSAAGRFGARGVGEPPVIPGANAVRNACGARITELPLTPDGVRSALAEHAPR